MWSMIFIILVSLKKFLSQIQRCLNAKNVNINATKMKKYGTFLHTTETKFDMIREIENFVTKISYNKIFDKMKIWI